MLFRKILHKIHQDSFVAVSAVCSKHPVTFQNIPQHNIFRAEKEFFREKNVNTLHIYQKKELTTGCHGIVMENILPKFSGFELQC